MALLCGLKIFFGSFFCLLDVVLLDLGIERSTSDPEKGGRPCLLPTCLLECARYQFTFSTCEREIPDFVVRGITGCLRTLAGIDYYAV